MASGKGPSHPHRSIRAPGQSGRVIEVRRCTSGTELLTLRNRWNRLVSRCSHPSLYLTHDWMTGWWEQECPPGRELLVLLAEEGDALTGIAPLVKITNRFAGLRIRRLELMTMGMYAYNPRNISASLEMFSGQGDHRPIDAFAAHLSASRDEWDYIRFHPLPEGSQTLDRLSAWAKAEGFGCHVRPVFANAVIDLPGEMETYLKSLSPTHRKNIRRMENAIRREGGYTVTEVTSSGDVPSLLGRMADIESHSWKASGGVGLSRSEVMASTGWQVRAAIALGGLELWFLGKDGKEIAFNLSIRYGNSVESLRASYDSAFRDLSPGNHLLTRELSSYMERGISRYNLMWGDFDYKLKWTSKIETCYEMYIFNRTPL
ncbi:MAG TPA: GNAT family N-acetyltransferase, partial [Bacteroidota bacterium]|nr:GNAT family N-acetyltransferase [Bacteroidota bacterium]